MRLKIAGKTSNNEGQDSKSRYEIKQKSSISRHKNSLRTVTFETKQQDQKKSNDKGQDSKIHRYEIKNSRKNQQQWRSRLKIEIWDKTEIKYIIIYLILFK